MAFPDVLTSLANSLRRLPGIGPRQALRLSFFLLRNPSIATAIASSLTRLNDSVSLCPKCERVISRDENLCSVCADRSRDHNMLAVVEEDIDLSQIEKTGIFRGVYFVLGGRFSPRGGTPEQQQLRTQQLKERILADKGTLKELILATNPTAEGDALALYLLRELKPLGIKITRLGRGLPLGGEIEHADEETLKGAIEHRT